jgi:hypothetical protein
LTWNALLEKTIEALVNPVSVRKIKAALWKGKGVLYDGNQLKRERWCC